MRRRETSINDLKIRENERRPSGHGRRTNSGSPSHPIEIRLCDARPSGRLPRVDASTLLAAFDEQVRRRPNEAHVEDDGDVVRCVAGGDGWNGVAWSRLCSANADTKIREQIDRYAGRAWEWKHYSYDQPPDLPERLTRAGFIRHEEEALLVADVAHLDLDVTPPEGVRLRPVADADDVAAFVRVHNEVFGGDYTSLGRVLLDTLTRRPGAAAAVLAVAGGTPVSAARIEFYEGTEFAGLWGGSTLPGWRGRGVFRSLVAHRAALAKARGYRYLQVDASPDSRPILRRLGFVELATTTPFTYGDA